MDNKYSSENQKEWSEDMKKRTSEVRAEYPELPQEIKSEIRQAAIKQCGGDYEGGMKGIQKDLLIGAYTTGAEIAHVYYNSIIEGKDKEIGKLEAAHEKSEHTLWLTVMAKDGTIEELQEQANKQQQIITELLTQKQQEITAKQAEIERITELLKGEYFKRLSHLDHPRQTLENLWSLYKKEHGLKINKDAADLPE